MLYYGEHLQATHRRDLFINGLEAIWLQVKFPNTSALFSVMYRLPDDNDFFSLIEQSLEKAWLKSSCIILLGDFNCDFSTREDWNGNGAKLRSIFEMFNMENVIQTATRITLTSRTLIDLIVTTRKDSVGITGVFPLGISDHNLIYATLCLKNKRPSPKFITTRNYKRLDEERFRNDIETAPFHVASVFEDEDDVLWAWQHLFNSICDEHAPLKQVKIRSISAPWISNAIRYKMNKRYKLFKAAVASKCPMLWQEYKQIRNEVTRALRQAKALYFCEMFQEVKKTSAYWNLLNKATNLTTRKCIGPLKRDDGSFALADDEKASLMNSYFATIGKKLAEEFQFTSKSSLPHKLNIAKTTTEPPPLEGFTISQQSIQTKVNALNIKKSTGPDNISSKLLKIAGSAIVPALTRLYQFSYESKSVFSAWKIARLTPIYKKDETERGNYHPVSLLSIPSKIMESIVNDALVEHVFRDNNLVSNRQWAYRPGHSTEYLMIHLTETWRSVIDSGKFVAVAFIDFRKAFDSIPHATLIMKLERHFGIKGLTLDWLKSYLTGRKQFTVLNGVKSDLLSVSMGIPQGSVLGPTLFTLFTNDLPLSVRSGSLYMLQTIQQSSA